MGKTKMRILLVGSILGSLVFGFENCSQVDFGAKDVAAQSAASAPAASDNVAYAWISGGWSACSATCGGGTQTQTVSCQRNDGKVVDASFCPGTAPATSQVCNIEACDVEHWVTSGFGACSATCGGGTQTQTVSCQDQNGAVVSNSRCTSPAPATSQACNTQACVTYSWKQSGFGACSASCGGGTQTQSVTCQSSNGQTVNNSFCSGTPPPSSQACNPQVCMTYHWAQSGFGACSATCGGGTQTQTVSCQDQNSAVVANSFCGGTPPATSQTCNPQACVVAGTTTFSTPGTYTYTVPNFNTLAVTVSGAGGGGGGRNWLPGFNGKPGSAGGTTAFGPSIVAYGGGGGAGGAWIGRCGANGAPGTASGGTDTTGGGGAGGGSGTYGQGDCGGTGGSGGLAQITYTPANMSMGTTVTITIGAGGIGGLDAAGTKTSGNGANGVVTIRVQ